MLAGLGREGGVVVGWNSGLEMCWRSFVDGSLGWWCLHGDVLSQKLAVA